jgi:hypothetical protein
VFLHAGVVQLLSHQKKRKRKKKKKKWVWRQFCEWLSEAAAHLPTAVSQLLLEALFMQISVVSLTLTWPCRLCLLRVLLGSTTTVTSFPFSKHTAGGGGTPAFSSLRVYLQLPLPWSFPHTAPFTSFPAPRLLGGAAMPAFSGWLVYLQLCEGLPLPPLWHSGRPAFFAMCLFLLLFIIQIFFSLFSLGGGQSVQGTMLIWPRVFCGSTVCRLAYLMVYIS